jgi:alkanesulfonate monooxygenase SsuD/methylene tetrahydromethanopterin reductase-like flavin-dependent oxidoreductase (luciferase family)
VWVAGGGEKKTLRVAARYADYTNFSGMPEEFAHKSEVLRGHCDAVGRDFGEIVRSANFNVVIGRDEREVARRLDWIRDHYTRAGLPEKVVESTVRSFADGPLVGTPEQVAEALANLQDLGMTYAITYFVEAAYDMSGVELFEREIMPAFVDHEEPRHLWHLGRGR